MAVFSFAAVLASSCGGGGGEACRSDTDCKGNRVCTSGACVDLSGTGGNGGSSGTGGGSGGSGGSTGTGGGASSCRGDFYVGETVYSGNLIAGTCDKTPPTNCYNGRYVVLRDNTCLCSASCNHPGVACDTGNKTVCQNVSDSSGKSFGNMCVLPAWNLCSQTGGTGGGSGGTAGGSGGTAGGSGTCKANGAACSDDSDCCSDDCFAGACD
ncbi:MAG: hypothetical protein IPJ65_25880 [Archangiaceae bacterium]|nr:hypothetical protein [Archangiaceae bacterium]